MTRETTYKGSTGNAFTMRGTIDWRISKQSIGGIKGGEKTTKTHGHASITALMGNQEKITKFVRSAA